MLSIFVPEPIPRIPLVPFLVEHPEEGNRLFQAIPQSAYAGIFKRVGDAQQSDIVIAPHEYVHLRKYPSYLAQCREQARSARVPLLISAYQDDPRPISIPGAFVIRPSAYRSELTAHEILMPAYVEDVGKQWGVEPLPKGERPIIAFTGKAGFSGMNERLRYLVRNYLVRHGPRRQGAYFRRRAIAGLTADRRLTFNAIIRKRYSAHRNTIEVPPAQAREDYIRSIQQAHFTLAPSGDGNYSLRFYETLSLGRIPILIDTDVQLPLADVIDYDAFIVRVPWRDSARAGDYALRFFNDHNEEQWRIAQRRARNIFESYLYIPSFLSLLFSDVLPRRTF